MIVPWSRAGTGRTFETFTLCSNPAHGEGREVIAAVDQERLGQHADSQPQEGQAEEHQDRFRAQDRRAGEDAERRRPSQPHRQAQAQQEEQQRQEHHEESTAKSSQYDSGLRRSKTMYGSWPIAAAWSPRYWSRCATSG